MTTTLDPATLRTLARYPADCWPRRTDRVSGERGGLSGATVWRVETQRGPLALRRWPLGGSATEQLRWIHAVARHAWRRGFQLLPVPLETADGDTLVFLDERLWDLAPWRPGQPLVARPTPAELEAALVALAGFHRAVEDFPREERFGSPPGLTRRLALAKSLKEGGIEAIERRLEHSTGPWDEELAWQVVSAFRRAAPQVMAELQEAVERPVPLRPCLRDVRGDHVLFEADRVTGLIDLGGLRIDHVAGDLARLLGDYVGDDRRGLDRALEAYGRANPLEPGEWVLLAAYDRSMVLLTPLVWLNRALVDGEVFPELTAVARRFRHASERLLQLAENL